MTSARKDKFDERPGPRRASSSGQAQQIVIISSNLATDRWLYAGNAHVIYPGRLIPWDELVNDHLGEGLHDTCTRRDGPGGHDQPDATGQDISDVPAGALLRAVRHQPVDDHGRA